MIRRLIILLLIVGCGTEPQDCAGVAGGTAELDNCNVCDSDSSNDNTTCTQDCAGIWGGGAVIDNCGICSGGNTGYTADSDLDECGVCGGDGTSCVYTVVQSMEQAIYSFDSVTLDGAGLEAGDWLVARNGDVIVGVAEWAGNRTEVSVMGEEWINSEEWSCDYPYNTCGMMLTGQTPQFYVFDASISLEYIAQYTASDGTVLQTIPSYQSLDYHVDLELHLTTDCNSVMGGGGVEDECGVCGGDGSTCN